MRRSAARDQSRRHRPKASYDVDGCSSDTSEYVKMGAITVRYGLTSSPKRRMRSLLGRNLPHRENSRPSETGVSPTAANEAGRRHLADAVVLAALLHPCAVWERPSAPTVPPATTAAVKTVVTRISSKLTGGSLAASRKKRQADCVKLRCQLGHRGLAPGRGQWVTLIVSAPNV